MPWPVSKIEKSYDSGCHALALKFVQDSSSRAMLNLQQIGEHTHKLAQEIQQAIEDYLEEHKLP